MTIKEKTTDVTNSVRKQRWEHLLKKGYPYSWLPRFVDVALSYSGDLEKYLQSNFLEDIKASLAYDSKQHEKRGISVKSLTLDTLYDENTPWMSGFITMMACRVRRARCYRTYLKVVKNQRELESLCLEHIYNRIPHFNPARGSFERYLHKFVPGYVGEDLRKEWNRMQQQTSLDAPLPGNPKITLIETIAAEDDSFEIEEVSTETLTRSSVLTTLENLLQNPQDWDLFYNITYGMKTCSDIARAQGVNPCKISRRMNSLRGRLRQSHHTAEPLGRCKKPRLENFKKHFSSAIDRDSFLGRIPRPILKQVRDCTTMT